MSDSYLLVERFPDAATYCRLRAEAGMAPRTERAADLGLAGTLYGVSVLLDESTVGMGRVIGDGGCHFQVVDVAVLPEHQGKGLGKRIMTALADYLDRAVPESASVSLLADGEAHRLYEQYGFRLSAPASVGMLRRK